MCDRRYSLRLHLFVGLMAIGLLPITTGCLVPASRLAACCSEFDQLSEENKALFQQFTDGMNAKDLSMIDQIIDPDFVDRDPPPGHAANREGLKRIMQMFFTGFPDLKVTITHMIAEGDLVVARRTTEGTQTGVFMGIPASTKKVSFTEMHLVRVANGKVVEHWGVADAMTMMKQLDVIPPD